MEPYRMLVTGITVPIPSGGTMTWSTMRPSPDAVAIANMALAWLGRDWPSRRPFGIH